MPKLPEAPGWWDWPAAFLVLFACACLAAGIFASGAAAATFAGAGAALAGAAAARIGDLFSESRARAESARNESRARAESARKSRVTDLDESRRLAYMTLMSKGAGDYGLAASLLNALVYHQEAATEEDAMKHLSALASGRDCDDSEEWLRGQIQRINAERKTLVGTL
jgi:hypothetical protein